MWREIILSVRTKVDNRKKRTARPFTKRASWEGRDEKTKATQEHREQPRREWGQQGRTESQGGQAEQRVAGYQRPRTGGGSAPRRGGFGGFKRSEFSAKRAPYERKAFTDRGEFETEGGKTNTANNTESTEKGEYKQYHADRQDRPRREYGQRRQYSGGPSFGSGDRGRPYSNHNDSQGRGSRSRFSRPSFGSGGSRDRGERPQFSRYKRDDETREGSENQDLMRKPRPSFGSGDRGRPYSNHNDSQGRGSRSRFSRPSFGSGGSRDRGERPQFSRYKRDDETREGSENHDLMRISKKLASLGCCSRRDAEELVSEGKVKIDGRVVTELYTQVGFHEQIEVNGKKIKNERVKTEVYLFHKPTGCVTTNRDPQGRKTVFDYLSPAFGRLITIGRLDYDTQGLLLLTNDGDFARQMELPSTGIEREYLVEVAGKINQEELKELENGVEIEGIFYKPMKASVVPSKGSQDDLSEDQKTPTESATIRIIIKEGKNREVRNVMSYLGLEVLTLTRVRYGKYRLDGVPIGCAIKYNGETGWESGSRNKHKEPRSSQYEKGNARKSATNKAKFERVENTTDAKDANDDAENLYKIDGALEQEQVTSTEIGGESYKRSEEEQE